MQGRVKKILMEIGLTAEPTENDSLADCGYDSLLIVLSISALEKEFSIKIPADAVTEENFATLHSLEKLVLLLGGK